MLDWGIHVTWWLIVAVFSLVVMVFWIWMLIDCLLNEPSSGNDKLIWVLVIIFTHWIGAVIYFLVRRPERIRTFGK